MGSRTIVITAGARSDGEPVSVDQFRNFGADVFRWLRDQKRAGEVDLGEIDRAVVTFAVRHVGAAMCRRVESWVAEEARRQHITVSLNVQSQ